MAADVAVQETIIPVAVVVAMVFLAAATTVVFGLFCYSSSVAAIIMIVAVVVAMVFSAAITTIAVTGLSGLSCFPASVAEIIMDAANSGSVGGVKTAHFKCLLLEYLTISII